MRVKCFLSLAVVVTGLPALAQTRFTAADYARAEKFMTYNTTPLVYSSGVRPSWISGERFYYRNTTAQGTQFILVDPAKGTRQPAFDHVKVAAALATAGGTGLNAYRLPFQEIDVTPDGQTVSFNYNGRHYECDTQGNKCNNVGVATASTGGGGRGGRGGRGRGGAPSPTAITAKVTTKSGEVINGFPASIDDWQITIRLPDGSMRSFLREGEWPKYETHNPLQAHVDLQFKYTDADIHNLAAYLRTLK